MAAVVAGSPATRDSNVSLAVPIAAECFLPPRIPVPRAWQRVAVAPVPGQRRQRKIWKRVGGVSIAPGNDAYGRATAELERQGQGQRKRARHATHIPAWGDARWDLRAEQQPDGKGEIDEARATISAITREECTFTSNETATTNPATFPEARLQWVPRKRHNTRWPIEPTKEKEAGMVAAEPVEVVSQIDEMQLRRRSTRRISRRMSLFPGEDSPRKLPMITLSPAKNAALAVSPVKRPPVSLSPTKVADSPLGAFRVNATPTKVILESPKTNPPAQSPAKPSSSPITSSEGNMPTPASKTTAEGPPLPSSTSPAPLMFDQPIPEDQVESQHEARRRISLQSARRTDRRSSGASRLLALKSARAGPSRRHSLTPVGTQPAGGHESAKGRRNTLDAFCIGPEEILAVNATEQQEDGKLDHYSAEEVVEVDMKKSFDIFGLPTTNVASVSARRPMGVEEVQAEEPALKPSAAVPLSETSSTASEGTLSLGGSSCTKCVEFTVESEGAGSGQAAVSPPPDEEPAWPTYEERPATCTDEYQFYPHDPEGLSTITEESTVSETPPTTDAHSRSIRLSETGIEKMTASLETPAPESTVHGVAQAVEANAAISSQTAVESDENEAEALATSQSVNTEQNEPETAPEAFTDEERPQSSDDAVDMLQIDDLCEDSGAQDVLGREESPPQADTSAVPLPGTPPNNTSATAPRESLRTPEGDARGVDEVTQPESSGFTPINGRSTSPNIPLETTQNGDTEAVNDSDELDADEVIDEDVSADEDNDEAAVEEDDTLTIKPPRPEMDTIQLQAVHDDSETEMLRKFVTRVTADKNAKAAAAAAALASRVARAAARRSGSLGSTTSSTGPPMGARPAAEQRGGRKPLVEKSPNSPSPAKKRKHVLILDGPSKATSDAHDDDDNNTTTNDDTEPRLKRRRKLTNRTDPVLNNDSPIELPNPSPSPSRTLGTRRSTRTRRLKPTAPSANAIALSMIPVRLPGMGAMDDATATAAATAAAAGLESQHQLAADVLAVRQQRGEARDLAAVTRANTRKNKGGAVPPGVVLAKQAEDPGWRMRELKGVWEAREGRRGWGGGGAGGKDKLGGGEGPGGGGGSGEEGEDGEKKMDGRKSRKGKGVRWAEELVRFQQADEQPSVFRGLAQGLLADVVMGDMDVGGVDEIAEAEPPKAPEPPAEKKARVAARKAAWTAPVSATTATAAPTTTTAPATTTRRTRSSRLQPPTPVAKISGAEKSAAAGAEKPVPEKPAAAAAPGLRTRARSLPKLASAAATAAAAAVPTAAAPPAKSASTSARSSGMATRRTKIAKLGMSGNGTPAPKRRGRLAA